MLLGEAFGHWRADGAGSEQVVCRLCEEEAERLGWVRIDRPPERRTSARHDLARPQGRLARFRAEELP